MSEHTPPCTHVTYHSLIDGRGCSCVDHERAIRERDERITALEERIRQLEAALRQAEIDLIERGRINSIARGNASHTVAQIDNFYKDEQPSLTMIRALLAEQPRVRKDEMNPTRAELGEEIRQMREQPREEA